MLNPKPYHILPLPLKSLMVGLTLILILVSLLSAGLGDLGRKGMICLLSPLLHTFPSSSAHPPTVQSLSLFPSPVPYITLVTCNPSLGLFVGLECAT